MSQNIATKLVLLFLVGAVAGISGCGRPTIGAPCKENDDCPSGLCLTAEAGFADGYCSADCSMNDCAEQPAGQVCTPLGSSGPVVCLRGCMTSAECQKGTQCYRGTCQPPCQVDADCQDDGYLCDTGSCIERPGAKVGESCGGDSACSSLACIGGACVQSCNRETSCPSGETCVLDRNATHLRGYCVNQRTTAARAPLGFCESDNQCQRGSCVMGACLVMCQHPYDCKVAGAGADDSCTEVPAPLTKLAMRKWPHMNACLPANQNFAVPIAKPAGIQTLLVPATARSVSLVVSAENLDLGTTVGMALLQDDSNVQIFTLWNPATDPDGYFRNLIRAQPNVGSSVLLFSSSPQRVPLRTAAYQFGVMGLDNAGQQLTPSVLAIYKLYNQPFLGGRMPLRIHVTDLSGLPSDCPYRTMTAGTAQTVLAPMVQRLMEIYAQSTVQVELGPQSYVASTASPLVDIYSQTSLSEVLGTAAHEAEGGLDLVLVRSINGPGVLGIAGGIPGAPGLTDNPRNGAVMSMEFLCMPTADYGLVQLAQTAAHELGHTLGLSHNRERNGQSDPLGDGTTLSESAKQEDKNLMYWLATSTPGEELTTEQGQVIRSMPQVQP